MKIFRLGLLALALLACSAPAFAQNAPTNFPGCQYLSSPGTLADKQTAILNCTQGKLLKVETTPAAGSEQDVNITGVGGNAVTTTVPVSGTVAATQSGTWTVQPGNTANTTPWLIGGYSTIVSTTITRPANTTTYTANDAWANATSGATYTTFAGVCRANAGQVLIPQIDIVVDENPAVKLQGVLWLFDTIPTDPLEDADPFVLAAADWATLTGNAQGFPFTVTNTGASGATFNGASLTGTTYHAHCASGATAIYAMVQVVNAYVPTSGEVMTLRLHTVAAN